MTTPIFDSVVRDWQPLDWKAGTIDLAAADRACVSGHRPRCLHEFFAVDNLERGLVEPGDGC